MSKYQKSWKTKVPGIRIAWNALLGGYFVVRGSAWSPLAGRFETKEAAEAWLERKK